MVSSNCQQKCPQQCGLPAVHVGTTTNVTTTTTTGNNTVHHPPPLLYSSCCSQKTPLKGNRNGPSPLRQLLPIAMFLLAFATVLSILIVYMDTTGNLYTFLNFDLFVLVLNAFKITAIRHQQFRLNMSRDYDYYGVRQDDPKLITFVREIQLKKYPMPFMKDSGAAVHNFTDHHELAPALAETIARLSGMRQNGIFVQSMPLAAGPLLTGPWLAETLNWAGTIIEPDPRKYFALRKESAGRAAVQIVHACVSSSEYPKEVRLELNFWKCFI